MIDLISAPNLMFFPDLAAQMFRLRHRVFKERLGWDVSSHNGMERDSYDALNPVYLISSDANGSVNGCWRFLPTTGPYMLKDTFPSLLESNAAPCDPAIWETSRFIVDDGSVSKPDLRALSRVTVELFCGLGEFCESHGLSEIVTVHDLRIARLILRVVGYEPKWSSAVHTVGRSKAVAARYDVKPRILEQVRQKFGIGASVIHNWVEDRRQEAA